MVTMHFIAHNYEENVYGIRAVYYEKAKAPLLGNPIATCFSRQDADLICSALNDYIIKGNTDA